MDFETLATILLWVYSGGGASVLTYNLMERIGALAALKPEPKRYVSWLINVSLVAAGFAIAVVFGYEPKPEAWRAWIELMVPMALASIMAAQTIHARLALSKRVN